MYHCARSSKWGDLLPMQLEMEENKNVEEETEKDKDQTT